MVTKLRPATQNDFLVTLADTKFIFSKFSGSEEVMETSEYTDPADFRLKSVRGPVKVENLTLEKPYVPDDDAELLEIWKRFRDEGEPDSFTITVQSVKKDKNRTPIGPGRIYQGCQLIMCKQPEVDLESSDVAMLELEFTADYIDIA